MKQHDFMHKQLDNVKWSIKNSEEAIMSVSIASLLSGIGEISKNLLHKGQILIQPESH